MNVNSKKGTMNIEGTNWERVVVKTKDTAVFKTEIGRIILSVHVKFHNGEIWGYGHNRDENDKSIPNSGTCKYVTTEEGIIKEEYYDSESLKKYESKLKTAMEIIGWQLRSGLILQEKD